MKALVTGGGGFLGSAIVSALLARGDAVTVLARGHYPHLADAGARTFRASITDHEALHEATTGNDVVFHVAAQAGDGGSWDSYYQPNVVGTRCVLRAARDHHVKAVVHTSSPSVVTDTAAGRSRWRAALTPGPGIAAGREEELPYASDATSYYSLSKALAEMAVLAAGRHTPLPTVALRPHLMWGPGDTQLIPRLIARARQGHLRLVGDGANLVDTTFIDDAVNAHVKAADALLSAHSNGKPAACTGKAYFISSGDPQPLASVINQALAAGGLPPVQRRIPFALAYAAGMLLETVNDTGQLLGSAVGRTCQKEPLMSRFLARQLATAHWFDISAAARDFGYSPQVSVPQGMQRLHQF